jgi:16S rRNA processing protein RimM
VSEQAPQLQAGRVGRPHGLDGSFYVTRPRAQLLTLGSTVRVGERTATIVRRAGTDAHPIVALEGVADREAVARLRGLALSVPAQAAPVLGEGEWWAHELEGCDVLAGAQLIGSVSRLLELPSCEALEVERADGEGSLLVPIVKDAVRAIDVPARRIEVDLDFLGEALAAPGRARRAGGSGGD